MRSHFILTRGAAMACAVTGAATLLSHPCPAQTTNAADNASNNVYNNGWQAGDNGGFGFTAWNFGGSYTSTASQHSIDSTSPYNQLGGKAWTLCLPDGRPPLGMGQVDSPNPPQDGSDLCRVGRGFAQGALQIGQTISVLVDNPTERRFYGGYTIRLVTGGTNTTYGEPLAKTRLAVGTFEYGAISGNFGAWYASPGTWPPAGPLYDTNTAGGMRLDVTLTGPNNYQLTMTPLANTNLAYTQAGLLANSGPIDWIQFDHYNTDSDFYDASGLNVVTDPKQTDFYVRSIIVTSNLLKPSIVSQPVSRVLHPGRTARFSASVLGSLPLNYRWRKDGVNLNNGGNISGALSDTLIISNVSAADIASYTLVATNAGGAVNSTPPATLTLVSPSGTPYESAVLAADPIAYWRLNEFANPATNPPAYEFAAGLAGKYENVATNGFNGIAGPRPPDWPGLEGVNRALRTTANTAQSWVTVPALNLNTNRMTMTAWIYPDGAQSDWCGLFFSRAGSTVAGLHYGGDTRGTGGMLAYTWNGATDDTGNTWGFFSNLQIPPDQWSFVAAVIDGPNSNATLYLYNINGQAAATNADLAHTGEAWNGEARIGSDPAGTDRIFNGIIDEVAVFNRALTSAQLLNLYNAAVAPVTPPVVTLTIQKLGPNVVLGWPQGTLQAAPEVSGTYTNVTGATSPFTNAPTANRKFYRVLVQ